MYIEGKMNMRDIELLIDSGANISLLNHELFLELEEDGKIELKPYEVPMVTADGTPMNVYGCAQFQFELGDEEGKYQHLLCVAEVGVDIILGYDFLTKFKAVVDLGQGSIELMDPPGVQRKRSKNAKLW